MRGGRCGVPQSQQEARPVGRTLVEQAEAWHALPSPLAGKTRDQYLKDAKLFQSWFVSATRKPYVGPCPPQEAQRTQRVLSRIQKGNRHQCLPTKRVSF